MPNRSPAAAAAPTAPTCEIWIRTVGTRRQAFARPLQPEGQRTRNWHGIQVAHAEKALRTGTLTAGEFAGSQVVPRETDQPEHPAACQFAVDAQRLNSAIDALNLSAAGAA